MIRFAGWAVAMIACSLSLTACTGAMDAVASASGVPPPTAYADRTVLDEQVAIGFERSVAMAADLATIAVSSGAVDDATVNRIKTAVPRARVAVRAVRAAYDAGNAASFSAALSEANRAISAVDALRKGDAP